MRTFSLVEGEGVVLEFPAMERMGGRLGGESKNKRDNYYRLVTTELKEKREEYETGNERKSEDVRKAEEIRQTTK